MTPVAHDTRGLMNHLPAVVPRRGVRRRAIHVFCSCDQQRRGCRPRPSLGATTVGMTTRGIDHESEFWPSV